MCVACGWGADGGSELSLSVSAGADAGLRSGAEAELRSSLALSLTELNPAALIFATGSWGRVQDVDHTLF